MCANGIPDAKYGSLSIVLDYPERICTAREALRSQHMRPTSGEEAREGFFTSSKIRV